MLAPLYKDVSKINTDVTEKLQNSIKFIRITNKDKSEGVRKFTREFLTFVDIADLPPHELKIMNNKNIAKFRCFKRTLQWNKIYCGRTLQ